uniref:Rx N-terminal domain-containing protein n=1 Tax=Fagus sylvatica TaxID=28930 RepID=A0A2N9G5I0_FAGSY
MEMLGSVVGSIISSMAEYCDYHKDADEHVKNLKRKWEVLESRKEDIESRLEAELRRGKKQKKEVELWLGEVHKIKHEINIEQVPARWKFLSRMRMGECASKKTKVVEDLSIQASGEGHLGLEDFSDEGKWREDLVKASLMYNNISRIPPNASPMCPKLSTLLLQGNKSLKDVPDSLFEHLHGLNILDLSNTGIESLPNSVSNLENLTTLRLGRCWVLKHVPSLAKLTKLRKLDLGNTGITEVPHGLEMLVNLRYLNLNVYNLKIMPPEILPKLSCLQYLIFFSDMKLEEVASLKNLETFGGRFSDMYEFSTYMEKGQLATYEIHVGSIRDLAGSNQGQKVKEAASAWVAAAHLHLEEIYVCQLVKQLEEIIEEEEEKKEEGMDTTKITLPRLKILNLQSLSELKSICSSSKLSPPPSLKKIEAEEEWWESLEWDCQDTKNVLQPFFRKIRYRINGQVEADMKCFRNLYWTRGEVSGFRASLKGRDSREPIRVELSLEGLGLSAVPSEVWESGEVIKVNLSRNAIQELPVELSSCISLQTLVLSRNKIKDWPGAILKSLPNLSCLKLDNNPLGQMTTLLLHDLQIPADGFQAVSRVQVLDLSGNAASLPEHPVFSSIPHLQELYLRRIQLHEVPSDIFSLQQLRILDLSQNSLQSVPVEFQHLTSLTELDLSDNNIAVLPPELPTTSHTKKGIDLINRIEILPVSSSMVTSELVNLGET